MSEDLIKGKEPKDNDEVRVDWTANFAPIVTRLKPRATELIDTGEIEYSGPESANPGLPLDIKQMEGHKFRYKHFRCYRDETGLHNEYIIFLEEEEETKIMQEQLQICKTVVCKQCGETIPEKCCENHKCKVEVAEEVEPIKVKQLSIRRKISNYISAILLKIRLHQKCHNCFNPFMNPHKNTGDNGEICYSYGCNLCGFPGGNGRAGYHPLEYDTEETK